MLISIKHPISKILGFFNLAIGNHKRYNCKITGYRKKISLSVMTVYLLMFTGALYLGDFSSSGIISAEKTLGMLSTAIIYSLGGSVISNFFIKRQNGPAAVVSTLMIGAQTAFVFNLFPVQIANMFYYMASTATMLFVYSLTHKDKLANIASEKLKNNG